MNKYPTKTLRSARSSGAVGTNAIVPKLVQSLMPEGLILDFGCGPKAIHTKALRDKGLNVVGFDLPENMASDFAYHDFFALTTKYDVIFASNVLNVQPSLGAICDILEIIGWRLKQGGLFICNYPDEPRHSRVSTSTFELLLNEHFTGRVKLTGRQCKCSGTGVIYMCFGPLISPNDAYAAAERIYGNVYLPEKRN